MKIPKNLHMMYLHAQSIPSPLHSTYYGIVQLIADNGGKVHESEVSKFEHHGQFRSRFTIQDGQWLCGWLQFQSENKESEKRKTFAPPTISEISTFFTENGSTKTEAENFRDFYESKGWKVGAVRMADWKAASRRWIKSNTPKTLDNGTDKVGSRNTRGGLNAMRDALNGGINQG